MQVASEHLTTLLAMQDIDKEIIQLNKKVKDLPQRAVILEVRAKRRSIEEKAAQLDELHADADERMTRLSDEDEGLAEKQQRVQDEIDNTQGGYRDIEARTKELNGFAKRRTTLESEMSAVGEELERIEGMQAQVKQALDDLTERETKASNTFVEEGGALRHQVFDLEEKREQLAKTVPEDVLGTFEKISERHGGVGLGYLKGSTCGVCRASIEGGRLADMKAQGNVASCPQCGRLLIIE